MEAQTVSQPDFDAITNAQQLELTFRKCKAAKGLALRTRALVAEGLVQMSRAGGAQQHEDIHGRCAKAVAASRQRCDRRLGMLERVQDGARNIVQSGHSMERSRSPSIESEHALRGASSSEESAIHETERLLGADGNMARWYHMDGDEEEDDDYSGSEASFDSRRVRQPSRRPAPGVQSALGQLRVEPFDDRERAAKFGLYEAYLAEVESMRAILFKFCEESRPLRGEVAWQEMDNRLRLLDKDTTRMGIDFFQTEWFVYHMMQQASRNNSAMASMLRSWEASLRPATESHQPNCPVCLEKFGPGRPAETLGCCHKVCKPCWSMWCKFMRAMSKRPFCPCCHHSDFLGAVNKPDEVAQELPPGIRAISKQSRGRSPAPPSVEQYTESVALLPSAATAEGRAPPPPARLIGASSKLRL